MVAMHILDIVLGDYSDSSSEKELIKTDGNYPSFSISPSLFTISHRLFWISTSSSVTSLDVNTYFSSVFRSAYYDATAKTYTYTYFNTTNCSTSDIYSFTDMGSDQLCIDFSTSTSETFSVRGYVGASSSSDINLFSLIVGTCSSLQAITYSQNCVSESDSQNLLYAASTEVVSYARIPDPTNYDSLFTTDPSYKRDSFQSGFLKDTVQMNDFKLKTIKTTI